MPKPHYNSILYAKYDWVQGYAYIFFYCAIAINKIWDRRYPDSAIKSIHVHSGPAYSCSWHPDADTHWLASAGRDKCIKVSRVCFTLITIRPPELQGR